MIGVVMKGWNLYSQASGAYGKASLAFTFARAYRTAGKVARAAVDKGTDRMVQDIKAGVPVDRGALRDSVRKERVSKKTVIVRAGGTPETMHPYGGRSIFDEAVAIEFGTTKMPAQPFFYPVVDRAKERLEQTVDADVGSAMTAIKDEG